MELSSVTSAIPGSGVSSARDEGVSSVAGDFETFLTLLTTQLQNQDPMNPLDSSDFAVQLATFSGVEQQVRTNDLLSDMIAGLNASGVAELAGWVGLEARIDAPVRFDGSPILLAPDPDPGSDAAVLVVTDALNRTVAREPIPATGQAMTWAGVSPTGAPFPAGTYTFAVESIAGGSVTSTKPVEHYALVREARVGISGPEIVTEDGAVRPASDVTALRRPDSP